MKNSIIAILLVFAPALVASTDCHYTCPDGWSLFEEDYTCLSAFMTGQFYTAAQSTCEGFGGNLVKVNSSLKNDFTRMVTGRDIQTWIGVWDEHHNQQWTYVDRSPLTYTNWYSGEPNNHRGKEACGHILQGRNGQWNDGPCDQPFPFVCEIPAIRSDVEPTPLPKGCPEGWSYYEDTVNVCIKLFTNTATFSNARSLCGSAIAGGDLMIPNEQSKMQLADVLMNQDISVWLGIWDEHHDQQWTYIDGSPVTFDRWLSGEPNNHKGREACGHIWATKDGQWNDAPCDTPYAYFCEAPAGTSEM